MTFSYDEIYGVNLDKYCRIHKTTINELIKKSELDIKILYDNLGVLIEAERKGPVSQQDRFLADSIHFIIGKKYKHVEHLKEWGNS